MPRVVFIHSDGRREEHDAHDGQSIMRLATSSLVDGIIGECGGDLSCATCHVFVEEQWAEILPPRSAEEELMLESAAVEPTDASRLSCQIVCTRELDGITVHIPETQW